MKSRLPLIIIILLFTVGLIGSAAVLLAPRSQTVNVISDGTIIRRIDLKDAKDERFTVCFDGRTNTVEIKDGRIRVADAECPDHTCVNMGWLDSSAVPIVCLPNHLMIEFADENSVVDAVTR